ncbi:MAG: hypothetical protein CM1200mP10_18260 [Candidatus Neomarinimicrobiota bacterium]|nr:MAG: hypothetical protein CM1200mP10_18260 [Candidatus Neomarinimicrobiota bacterium]
MGGGSFFEGLATLGRDNPHYLAVLAQENIDGKTVTVPWPTLFTGMMFIQVFLLVHKSGNCTTGHGLPVV